MFPEFYGNGLRDFNVEESWEDGDRVVKGGLHVGFPSRWSAPSLLFGGRGSTKCRPPPSPPTCYPFVIPTSFEKVSLILSCVKQNKRDGPVLPTFRLEGGLSAHSVEDPPGTAPFRGAH